MDSMNVPICPRRRLLAACVALAAILVPSAAQAAQPGINVAGNDPGQIAKALATNAKLVRFFVEWRTLQPSKGDSYPSKDAGAANLATQIDAAITQVNAAGAKPIFVIVGAPAWVRPPHAQHGQRRRLRGLERGGRPALLARSVAREGRSLQRAAQGHLHSRQAARG
jgi:hypothetical protein